MGMYPQVENEFLARFGNMLIVWNKAEYWARQLINWQVGGKSLVLTADINSVSAREALCALSKYVSDVDLAGHLKHFADYFDTIRVYRNYYAHGVMDLVSFPDRALGIINQISSHGELKLESEQISADKFDFVIDHCITLDAYARAIQCAFISPGGGIEVARKEWPSWPEKPPLPVGVGKNRFPIGRPWPPQPASPP